MNGPTYVWCFDHGRLHNFSNGAWCTAWWVELNGGTETDAMADKTSRFGDALFYDKLTLDQQTALAYARRAEQDPHADCIQPHLGPDGEHHDCDGHPI